MDECECCTPIADVTQQLFSYKKWLVSSPPSSELYWKLFREKSICNDFSSVKKQIGIWILLLCKFYSILLYKQKLEIPGSCILLCKKVKLRYQNSKAGLYDKRMLTLVY